MSAVPPTVPKSAPSTTTRVHRMRVARGACWVIVGALAIGALLTLLDAFVRLPEWFRGLALAVWVTGVGVMVWRLVARRVAPDPNTTSAHARTELPGNLRAASAAVLAIGASLLTATVVPGALDHIRRVALPWTRTTGPILYRVKVTSGEPVVRRGDAVTLSAYAEKLDPGTATPEEATLVCRYRTGAESRHTMSGDGRGAFHATRSAVETGFEYRVEIGAASSDWFEVAALDPVKPTGESVVEVVPPSYAPASAARVFPGFKPFIGTQYSTAELRLRFNRPAATAFIEWRADASTLVELVPIALAPDKHAGIASFRLKQDGVATLVTVAEVGNRSLRSAFSVRVRVDPDTPPRFERIAGVSPHVRVARPGTHVPIAFTATDDIALERAVLEYLSGANTSAAVLVPINLTGQGTARATGMVELDLSGLARVGESIRFRIRIADTRRLGDPSLKPQEAVFPESGWSEVVIQDGAPPLLVQDVRLEAHALNQALVPALAAVRQALSDAERVRAEAKEKPNLTIDQMALLTNASDRLVREAIDQPREAARQAEFTPELRPLAAAIRQTIAESIVGAEDAVRRSAIDNPSEREATLGSASRHLEIARQRLGDLIEANSRFQQARLDGAAIAALASEEVSLANLARPNSVTPPNELARTQRALFGRFRTLIAESEVLRTSVDRARKTEYLRLVAATESLSAAVRDLGAAARQLNADTRHAIFGKLALEQKQIVSAVAALATKSATAARLAAVEFSKSAEFTRIAELIEAGMTVEALTAIEERVQQLDALATALDNSVDRRRDPKVEIRFLGAWQEDLHKRFVAATGGKPATFEKLPAATRAAIVREQLAIRLALQAVRVPPDEEIRNLKSELVDQLGVSASVLGLSGTSAEIAMKHAIEQFTQLSERVPTISDRLMKARTDLGRMQQAQEEILSAVEQTRRAPDSANRLTWLIKAQQKQVRALELLDVPGTELRMARVSGAMAAAASSISDGDPADALVSQKWVSRELDRLKQLLDDVSPIDDRVVELAVKLNAAAAAFEKLGLTPSAKQIEAQAAEARELARQAVLLAIAPEATVLGNDSRQAAFLLEASARDATTKPNEFRKHLRRAADAMTLLSDRLNGAESEHDRVRRLAWNRHTAVNLARLNHGKPINPDASAGAIRQLTRESEELGLTRGGIAGVALKTKALEQYAQLKSQPYPEQKAALQAALAETLDELAAVMADIPGLTQTFDRVLPPRAASDADAYLPTPALAESIRDIARNQRAFRDRLTGVEEEVRKRTAPEQANPIAPIEKQQRDLAASITRLARSLEGELEASAAKIALKAAIDATLAADGLANGMVRPATGSAEEAARSLKMLAALDTKHWAKTAAELAAIQDAIHLSLRPLDTPGAVAAQLKARGEELTRRAADLASNYPLAAQEVDAGQPIGTALLEAAKEIRLAESLLAESTQKLAAGSFAESARSQGEALDRLRAALQRMAGHTKDLPGAEDPDPAAANAAEQLRRAERSMRMALEELDPKPDRVKAEKAMRSAAEALQLAGKLRTELKLQLRP